MKEKIEKKIEAIMEYIIAKPTDKITADDYMILAYEVRDIRFREHQEAVERRNDKRMEQLMGMAVSPLNCAAGPAN